MAAGKEDSKQDLFLKMYMGGQNTGLVFRTISSLSPKAPKPPSPRGGGAMNSVHLSSLFKKYFEAFLFPLRHGSLL